MADESNVSDREKWEAERGFREREIAVKEQELDATRRELKLRETEMARSRWTGPLGVGIIVATIAAGAQIFSSYRHDQSELDLENHKTTNQRALEVEKAERTFVLSVIDQGDPKTISRLAFLAANNLITNGQLKLDIAQTARSSSINNLQPGEAGKPPDSVSTIIRRSGWIGGGSNQSAQCAIQQAVLEKESPGRTVTLTNSDEQSRRDLLGHVEYNYECIFTVQTDQK